MKSRGQRLGFHLDGGAPGCGWPPGQVDAVQQVHARRQAAVHLRLQCGVLRRGERSPRAPGPSGCRQKAHSCHAVADAQPSKGGTPIRALLPLIARRWEPELVQRRARAPALLAVAAA
jgi:hypothetical protein